MKKRNFVYALFFVLALFLLSVLGVHAVQTTPTFSYAAEEKRVYLTFDDGPSTVVTSRILDALKSEGVKATFFVVSDRARTRTQTLKRIAEEGHTLGVHSATHSYESIYSSVQALLLDIQECADFIRSVTGKSPAVYRFPGGEKSKELRLAVEHAGYKVVGWNACCRDEELYRATPQKLFEESVLSSKGKRSVVLLCHDSANHKETAEMLPYLIAYYRAQGYAFCAF